MLLRCCYKFTRTFAGFNTMQNFASRFIQNDPDFHPGCSVTSKRTVSGSWNFFFAYLRYCQKLIPVPVHSVFLICFNRKETNSGLGLKSP